MAEKADSYKNNSLATNLLFGLSGVEIVVCVIVILMTFLPRLTYFVPGADTVYFTAVHSLRFLPTLTTLSLLAWIFNANRNARSLSSEALNDSPIWAIGWFFVPIASLFKPYVVITDIYQSSRQPLNWHKAKRPTIVLTWWLVRLLADLVGLTTLMTRFGPQDIVTNGVMLFCVATLIHQALLIVIAARVNRWQIGSHSAAQVF